MMGKGTLSRDLEQPASALILSERCGGIWFQMGAVQRPWPEIWSSTPLCCFSNQRRKKRERVNRDVGKTRAEGQIKKKGNN